MPDIDALAEGIETSLAELVALARRESGAGAGAGSGDNGRAASGARRPGAPAR
jgi:hypothetical protein